MTNRNLILSGVLFTIVLFLWPIFMSLSQPQGVDIEQLNWIQSNLTLYKIQFFFAFLISPSIIYLMVSQLYKQHIDNYISTKIGFIFIVAYFVLNSVSYASQIVIVPKFIISGNIEQARVWYFGSSISVTYFINQMGYCFWGVGAIILFVKSIKGKGMIKYLSIIYTLSAILSIIAFIGLLFDSKSINSMTLYSGLILIPVGIMTTIWGIQENIKERGNVNLNGV